MSCLSIDFFFNHSCIFVSYSYAKVIFTLLFEKGMLQLIRDGCYHSEPKHGLAHEVYARQL